MEKDLRETARKWLKAAQRGNPEAQYNLGLLYATGIDGPPDKEKALYWLQKADEQGFIPAFEQIWKLKYSSDQKK